MEHIRGALASASCAATAGKKSEGRRRTPRAGAVRSRGFRRLRTLSGWNVRVWASL